MREFLFYIEGLNREEWVNGITKKNARQSLWNSLTDSERDRVVQFECLDERET